jgi:hypothetical protein
LSTKSFKQLLLEGALSPCAQLLDSKNLTAAWDAVQLAIDHQLDEIQAHRARYISATPVRMQNETFTALKSLFLPHKSSLLWSNGLHTCFRDRRRPNSERRSWLDLYWELVQVNRDTVLAYDRARLAESLWTMDHPHWH